MYSRGTKPSVERTPCGIVHHSLYSFCTATTFIFPEIRNLLEEQRRRLRLVGINGRFEQPYYCWGAPFWDHKFFKLLLLNSIYSGVQSWSVVFTRHKSSTTLESEMVFLSFRPQRIFWLVSADWFGYSSAMAKEMSLSLSPQLQQWVSQNLAVWSPIFQFPIQTAFILCAFAHVWPKSTNNSIFLLEAKSFSLVDCPYRWTVKNRPPPSHSAGPLIPPMNDWGLKRAWLSVCYWVYAALSFAPLRYRSEWVTAWCQSLIQLSTDFQYHYYLWLE